MKRVVLAKGESKHYQSLTIVGCHLVEKIWG
jgi:hypothetical protein